MDREFDSPAHQYKRAEQLARENADLLTRLKAAEARAEQYEKCLRNLLPYLPLTSTGAEAIRAVLADNTTLIPQKDKTDDDV